MKRIPLPHSPNGWFKVVFSDELEVGDVKAIHQFGKELVVYRGEDGAAHVFEVATGRKLADVVPRHANLPVELPADFDAVRRAIEARVATLA